MTSMEGRQIRAREARRERLMMEVLELAARWRAGGTGYVVERVCLRQRSPSMAAAIAAHLAQFLPPQDYQRFTDRVTKFATGRPMDSDDDADGDAFANSVAMTAMLGGFQ